MLLQFYFFGLYGSASDLNNKCQDNDECETGNDLCTETTSERNGIEREYVGGFLSILVMVLTCMLHNLQDSAGEILCYCPNGYTLDSNKACQDINECETGNNLCAETTSKCINTEGGYVN